MIEEKGDLWELPAEVICVTTNGATRGDGRAVMGGGCAREAADRYPSLPKILGQRLCEDGNHVFFLGNFGGKRIYSFPTKHSYRDALADEDLIRRSAEELREQIKDVPGRVLIPRPGCGLGGLAWSVVRPMLAKELPDARFVIVDFA
jgi:hypothetical protein